MDRQDNDSAEVQTTKVAETTPTNVANNSTDTPIADTNMEESRDEIEPKEQSSPKPDVGKQHSPLPKQDPRSSRSPEQKRRPSRPPSPFTKRQRTSLPPTASLRDEARSRAPVRPVEDKARNRRLFGGMLSTIAAKPNQRAARTPRPVDTSKREELERRAAEREKARLKEEGDARREKELRRREDNKEKYINWERDTILAKADNERIRAEFLKTKAKPALYYKPYILTKDQKDTLNQQIDDTELQIEKSIRRYEETHPDQPPLPWKPLPPPADKDSMDVDDKQPTADEREDAPQVSKSSPGNDVDMKDEPVSKMDDAQERSSEQRKDKLKADDFDEDVIETSEGGVSLIY